MKKTLGIILLMATMLFTFMPSVYAKGPSSIRTGHYGLQEGYVANYKVVTDGNMKNIRVYLKYDGKERVIKGIKRISKPGRRVYSSVEDMPRVLSGLGIAIVSTSKGIVTDRVARRENVGGEILAFVW